MTDTPYLTQDEAAAYIKYDDTGSFVKWADKVGLPKYQPSRKILYRKDEIEQAVENWRPSKRGVKAGSCNGAMAGNSTVSPLAQFRKKKPSKLNSIKK